MDSLEITDNLDILSNTHFSPPNMEMLPTDVENIKDEGNSSDIKQLDKKKQNSFPYNIRDVNQPANSSLDGNPLIDSVKENRSNKDSRVVAVPQAAESIVLDLLRYNQVQVR